MISKDPKMLLFIEPKDNTVKPPVIDSLTRKMTASLRRAKAVRNWFGWHEEICGCKSSCSCLELSNKLRTNSLAIHYVAYHREEIPKKQLQIIQSLNDREEQPIIEELLPK